MPSLPPVVPLSDAELLDLSPFLLKLSRRRLAPVRYSQLLATARNRKTPKEPEPWECCGSSCKPCVRELWREEKRVWEECHPDGEEEEESEDENEDDKVGTPKIEIELEERLSDVKIVTAEEELEEGEGEDAVNRVEVEKA
jgi:hypothetical protein